MIKKLAYAKINISLDVVSKREDGYHNLDTIMTKISLYDEMTFEKNDRDIEIFGMDLNLKDNYIYKAYDALKKYTNRDLPISVKIKKNIPMAAGLAGGTSNGAATLHAINELYGLNLSDDELFKIGLSLGADFPFMLQDKNVRARGVGEVFTFLEDFSYDILLVNPGYGISTVDVYKKVKIDEKRINIEKIIEALYKRDFKTLEIEMANKMEEVVFKKHRDILEIKNKLRDFGGISLMSGSGASVFAIFKSKEKLDGAYEYFKDRYKNTFKLKVGDINGSF